VAVLRLKAMKDPQQRKPPDATTPSRANRREPRLPHERDQSSEPQGPVNEDARNVGEQAARDLKRGLVDTDRGPVLDRLNADHFTPAAKRAARKRR
jgi:hypothetical protein